MCWNFRSVGDDNPLFNLALTNFHSKNSSSKIEVAMQCCALICMHLLVQVCDVLMSLIRNDKQKNKRVRERESEGKWVCDTHIKNAFQIYYIIWWSILMWKSAFIPPPDFISSDQRIWWIFCVCYYYTILVLHNLVMLFGKNSSQSEPIICMFHVQNDNTILG